MINKLDLFGELFSVSVNGQDAFWCLYFKIPKMHLWSFSFCRDWVVQCIWMGDRPNVCLKSGKYEALYENIPIKEQLPGPFCVIEFTGSESRNEEWEYPQLATVRIHYKKRIKNKTVLAYFSAHHCETPLPPFSPSPGVSYPSSVFLCFLYSCFPPSLPV